MTKSRIFLFFLLAFIAGVSLRSFVAVPLFFIWLALLSGAMPLFFFFRKDLKAYGVLGLCILSFALGIFRFDEVENIKPDLSSFYGQVLELRGFLYADPELSGNNAHLFFRVTEINERVLSHTFNLSITARRYPEYHFGDLLLVRGKIEKPENFGDFDYISYLSRYDIYGTLSFPRIEKTDEGGVDLLSLSLSRIKRSFEGKIDAVLPEPHAAFLKGLLLGERSGIPEELKEDFARTGTTHIVALSGYNITIVGRFFMMILLFLTIPFRVIVWIAGLSIVLFVVLTGASPSVVRAGIMGILVLFAEREGRVYQMTNALAFAGALMIYENPKILRFDTAFELSFLSTIGLIYVAPYFSKKFDRIVSWVKLRQGKSASLLHEEARNLFSGAALNMRNTLIETLSAQCMVLPLLIYLFGRVSLVSPITNILVLAAIPYAMAGGVILGVLGYIAEPLSRGVGLLVWLILEYKIKVIEFFANVPLSSVSLGKWSIIPLVFFYAILFYKLWKNSPSTSK